jgi:hypothetical protein
MQARISDCLARYQFDYASHLPGMSIEKLIKRLKINGLRVVSFDASNSNGGHPVAAKTGSIDVSPAGVITAALVAL